MSTENKESVMDSSDIMESLVTVLDEAISANGYRVLEGDNDTIYVKHVQSGCEFEIKVSEL